jgi:hypothetical protein
MMKKVITNRIKEARGTLKIHLCILTFILAMLLIFLSFAVLIPKNYKGEKGTFLSTPPAENIKNEQEFIRQ